MPMCSDESKTCLDEPSHTTYAVGGVINFLKGTILPRPQQLQPTLPMTTDVLVFVRHNSVTRLVGRSYRSDRPTLSVTTP